MGNYYALRDDYALKYVDARKNKITGLEVLSVLPSIEEMHLQDNMIRFGHQQQLHFLFGFSCKKNPQVLLHEPNDPSQLSNL